MSRLFVIGAGGHAKVLVDALVTSGTPPVGLVDADPARHGDKVLGIPILGGDDVLADLDRSDVLLINGIGTTGCPDLRMTIQGRLGAQGFRFARVRHPSAVIGTEVVLGEGVQIMAGAVIQAGTRADAGVIVNTRAAVDHDCRIGAFVHLAPGAILCGGVRIGEASHIGAGAVVLQCLAIGRGCLVAANACVTTDLGDQSRVRGVPARSWRD